MPTITLPTPSTTTSTSGASNVSFNVNNFVKQFVDAHGSRFEESQKLTQDLLIDMNLQFNGNGKKGRS